MRRAMLIVILVALASGAAAWTLTSPAEPPGMPAAPPHPVLPQGLPSIALLGDLGLPDADQYEINVLEQGGQDLLVIYPKDVNPVETAARWSLAITTAGLRKTEDWSRAGRTVLRFEDGDTSVLLAVGRTTEGPFVLYSHPAMVGHWATKLDADAPAALRALLPVPDAQPSTP